MKIIEGLSIFTGVFLAMSVPVGAVDLIVSVPGPSGGDDTAVLQTALDDCMNNHPAGCTIQLSAGTYRSQQLFGENFHGSVKGMGMDATTVQVLPFLEVTPGPVTYEFDLNLPSRTNKLPVPAAFHGG